MSTIGAIEGVLQKSQVLAFSRRCRHRWRVRHADVARPEGVGGPTVPPAVASPTVAAADVVFTNASSPLAVSETPLFESKGHVQVISTGNKCSCLVYKLLNRCTL